jgi:polar amino acid transport system substrate-binding protein
MTACRGVAIMTLRRHALCLLAAILALGFLLPAGADRLAAGTGSPPSDLPGATSPSPGREPPRLVLSSEDGPPYTMPDGSGIVDGVLKEAFRRVGVEVTIISVPAERALINANEGIEDGNFLRIAGLSEKYPRLIQVPEKLVDYDFVAFSRHVGVATAGWESLRPFNVAFVRGWKILEENVTGARSLQKVRDQEILFHLLDKGRVDLVIYSRRGGMLVIKELGLEGVKVLEPPLARREMFLYLNDRHAAWVAPVSEALRNMKEDGAYQRIMDRDPE